MGRRWHGAIWDAIRHAGFLTASSALAKVYPDDGPHLIYLPERAFDPDKFIADVNACYAKYGRCVIAVSEGIQDKNGTAISSSFPLWLWPEAPCPCPQ